MRGRLMVITPRGTVDDEEMYDLISRFDPVIAEFRDELEITSYSNAPLGSRERQGGEDYVISVELVRGGLAVAFAPVFPGERGFEAPLRFSYLDTARLTPWFRSYRRRLGDRASPVDRASAQLLDALGSLLQHHDALVEAFERVLADRNAAVRRVEMLERELDQLRAANAEPMTDAKRSMRLGIATTLIGLIAGLGSGYAAAVVQGDATVTAARIEQETLLTQTVIAESSKAGGLPTDPHQLADVVREAAVSLRRSCQ